MIEIASKKNKFTYNVYHIVKAFFPEEEITQKVDEGQEALVTLKLADGTVFSVTPGEVWGPGSEQADHDPLQVEKWEVTRRVYRHLSEQTGRKLAWGMLTGVRPTKMAMQKIEEGQYREEIVRSFMEDDFVSREKAELAYEVACREKHQLDLLNCRDGFSLYAGIPFCPSVCSYCSFSSSPIAEWKDRVEDYLNALEKEIRALGKMAKNRVARTGAGIEAPEGKPAPDTVYIGGGTPTTLTAGQLDRLLGTIAECFDVEHALEFTVEAGRPDSITEEKLAVIRKYPVTRISINPQTMQQKTLDLVGRKHTVAQVEEAFRMARSLGFDNINMDLIAGLPGETAEDMEDTLRRVEALAPDSLTVHALAIKRAARFGQEGRAADMHTEIDRMIEEAAGSAARMGLVPYYLYRQKNIAGNFENVGYAKVDKAGIYIILIMEEKQTILAAGAGASTKFVLPEKIRMKNGKETNLIRIENVKNITEYISRIDEMIERKGELLWR